VLVTQFCYISRDAAVDTVSNIFYAFLGRRLRIKDHTATSLTVRELAGMLGRSTYAGRATNSASWAATFASVFSSCKQSDPLVLVPDDRCILCAECDAIQRGRSPMEKHHLAGRHNGPWCMYVPANVHRRLTAMQRFRWEHHGA
jgi:hypothetical protein